MKQLRHTLSLLSLLIIISISSFGQHETTPDSLNISFGEITRHDFMLKPPVTDSGADAIILSDIGKTALEGYEHGFRTVFTRTRRIRLNNQRAFKEAIIELNFSADANGSGKLKNLKAITYNLENGQIVKTLSAKRISRWIILPEIIA